MARLVIALLLAALVTLSAASSSRVHVFRLWQAEKHNGIKFGAQKTALNLIVATTASQQASLNKHLLVVPIEQLSVSSLDDALSAKHSAGLLILLPKEGQTLSAEEQQEWAAVELRLATQAFDIPIYFAFRGDRESNIDSLYSHFVAESSGTDQYQVLVSAEFDPKPIKSFAASNVQGWLLGTANTLAATAEDTQPGQDGAPTIALFANVDSFAVVPELARGGYSGLIALLRLARLFNGLYLPAGSRTQGKHNLLFVATQGARLSFAGTRHWLESADARLLDALELAICLDSLGGHKLHLHVSRPPKDPQTKRVYEIFTSVASALSIPFEIVQRKINISDPEVYWEHEQFSRKKILAGTISDLQVAVPGFSRSKILDSVDVSVPYFDRNLRFVSEVVAKLVYGGDAMTPVLASSADSDLTQGWARTLSRLSRQVGTSGAQTAAQVTKDVLSSYLVHATSQNFQLDESITFYNSSNIMMEAYRTKSAAFDGLLLISVVGYLVALYATCRGVSGTLQDILAFVKGTRASKFKRS